MFKGESHGFRRADTIAAALEAELSFYGQVLGFTPPGIPQLKLTEPGGPGAGSNVTVLPSGAAAGTQGAAGTQPAAGAQAAAGAQGEPSSPANAASS